MPGEPRVSVVVLTHDRCDELVRTLDRLARLPARPPLIVVDNGSSDATAERVARDFAHVELVRCAANRGAAGRNAGVERVRTPYVAFSDDDCWWAEGALARAADALDAHPRLGAVAARVLVGADERPDPTCALMASSPLDSSGLPGPALIGFMAGAVVMRTAAYREAGGYEPRLFIGAEEELLGLDLAALGWRMAYLPEVVAHHHPSLRREARARQVLSARNRLWIAWLRLPARQAWRESATALRLAAQRGVVGDALIGALRGLPCVLRQRRTVPARVAAMHAAAHAQPRASRERKTR